MAKMRGDFKRMVGRIRKSRRRRLTQGILEIPDDVIPAETGIHFGSAEQQLGLRPLPAIALWVAFGVRYGIHAFASPFSRE